MNPCIWLGLIFSIILAIAAEDAPVGGPGLFPAPDTYNSFGIADWNRTYGPAEPQQIHLSIANEAKFAKVQFATSQAVQGALLKYWPKKHQKAGRHQKPVIVTTSEVCSSLSGVWNVNRGWHSLDHRIGRLSMAAVQSGLFIFITFKRNLWNPLLCINTKWDRWATRQRYGRRRLNSILPLDPTLSNSSLPATL